MQHQSTATAIKKSISPDNGNKFACLIGHLLTTWMTKDYKRAQSNCYEQHVNDNGWRTHYWQLKCSIHDFVFTTCVPLAAGKVSQRLVNMRHTTRAAIEYLSHSQNARISDLIPCPWIFSFKNGLYFGDSCTFLSWASTEITDKHVAINYFHVNFDVSWTHPSLNPIDIPTPNLDSLFEAGDLEWIYAFMGRLLWPVNQRDRWERCIYLEGAAKSNTFQFIDLLQWLVPSHYRGVINSCATVFSLSTEKIFYSISDGQPGWLDRGTVLSMICGESATVHRKFRSSVFVDRWPRRLCLLQSQLVICEETRSTRTLQHKEHFMSRYCFRISFNTDSQPIELQDAIKTEVGALVAKITRCYQQKLEQFGTGASRAINMETVK